MSELKQAELKPYPSPAFSVLEGFLPASVDRYIQNLEQFALDAKTSDSSALLLRLLKDWEQKRVVEEKSLFKPSLFYKHRSLHTSFFKQYTQQSELNLIDFFETLEGYTKNLSSNHLMKDQIFARIIAWLHYFEPFLMEKIEKISLQWATVPSPLLL